MSIFASTPPKNTDPKPWWVDGGNSSDLRFAEQGDLRLDRLYAPRPEFDQARANRANPILVEARDHLSRATRPDKVLATWLRWIDQPDASSTDPVPWVDEERDHARRVLQRLARAYEA